MPKDSQPVSGAETFFLGGGRASLIFKVVLFPQVVQINMGKEAQPNSYPEKGQLSVPLNNQAAMTFPQAGNASSV